MKKNKAEGGDLRRALHRFMSSRDLEVADWTRRAGVSSGSLYNLFKGRSDSVNVTTLNKLALAEGVAVSQLTGDYEPVRTAPITTVRMRGKVSAGLWQDALEMLPDEQEILPVPVPTPYKDTAFGLLVDGPSMNLVYPAGTVLICVSIYDYGKELRPGNKVVVYRHGSNQTIEATVKEMQVDEQGQVWLWPRSSHPAHQQPLPLPRWPDGNSDALESDGDSIEVSAVVIGSYRPEIDPIA